MDKMKFLVYPTVWNKKEMNVSLSESSTNGPAKDRFQFKATKALRFFTLQNTANYSSIEPE